MEKQKECHGDCILRPQGAAAYLGVSVQSVYRFSKLGLIPRPLKIGLRASGWRKSDLDKFIASREQGAMPYDV